jgi:hypothetical protein
VAVKWWIVIGVGALAIAGIILWRATNRQHPGESRPTADPRRVAEPPAGGSVGERPQLAGPDAAPVAAPFAEERRDPGFADPHEEEARARAEAAIGDRPVRIERVECRSARCEIVIAGGEGFDEALAAMQDERGFYGWAREMMVTGLTRDVRETRVTVVLTF